MQGVILDVVKRVMIEDCKVQAIRKRQIFFLKEDNRKKNVSKNEINLYAIECV